VPDPATAPGYTEFATGLARWAIAQLRAGPRDRAAKRHPADIVTDTDTRIEDYVRAQIAATYPGHGVLGEERPATQAAPGLPTWYLDPVDGTTNFASGLGWSSFTIALADADGPLLGVVADPQRDEVFTAWRGRGARCNADPVFCTPAADVAGTVLLTELNGHLAWPGMYQMIDALGERHGTVRVMGSSALSLAQLAAGRAAAVVLGEYHPVDTMAGLLIAAEAGAVVDHGTPPPAGVTAAAPALARQVTACISRRGRG
jgi:myo-inositol-1(or 4)-monophosphatase